MPTTPPAVTALPTPPSRSDPANFPTRGDAFLTALPVFQTQNNAVATNVFNNAVEGAASAVAALASQGAAAGSAGAAANSAAASATATAAAAWVSAAPYAIGAAAWSPLTGLVYRRKVAGAGTVDPSLDPTNWRLAATVDLQMVTVTGTSFAAQINGRHVLTNAAKTTLVLPSTPTLGEVVGLLVANGRTDNEVDPGGNRISSFPPGEKLTVNSANATLALIFSGAGAGWVPYKFDAAAMPGAPAMVVASGTGFAVALPDGTQATLERVEPIGVNPIRRWDSFYNAMMRACRPVLQPMPARVRPHTNTGTQIYVDPTVVGPGTGTLGDPYKSLVTAVTAVASNQSVLIKAGTTAAPTSGALFTNASGASATAAIVIGVYQPVTGARVSNSVGAATIDCAGTASNAFYLDGKTFHCFDGIRFTNKPAGAGAFIHFTGASGNNQVLNCEGVSSTANSFEVNGTVGNSAVEGCVITGSINGVAIGSDSPNFSANYNSVVGAVSTAGAIQLFQTSAALTGCTIAGNSIVGTSAHGNYGVRIIASTASVQIFGNSISLVTVGVALGDSGSASGDFSGTIVENNYILNAGEFGVHLFGAIGSWILQANRIYRTGSFNNTTTASPDLYGRAVEIYGLNATTRMTRDGTIRFNVLAGTFNFIGNGSEGVGLGFDDFSANCTGYANICVDNEGCGIQFYNNRSHTATGNLVINNNYQPVSRNQTWVTNFQGQIVSEKANFHLIANNTVLSYGFANQRFGISFRDEGAGSKVSNNLIVGASERGIVLDPALVVESHNTIESSPIAVADLALVQVSNGTGTTAVAAGASALQGLLFTPPSGGICDNTGSVTFARMSSLQGVPLGVRTPIGASHASA